MLETCSHEINANYTVRLEGRLEGRLAFEGPFETPEIGEFGFVSFLEGLLAENLRAWADANLTSQAAAYTNETSQANH